MTDKQAEDVKKFKETKPAFHDLPGDKTEFDLARHSVLNETLGRCACDDDYEEAYSNACQKSSSLEACAPERLVLVWGIGLHFSFQSVASLVS